MKQVTIILLLFIIRIANIFVVNSNLLQCVKKFNCRRKYVGIVAQRTFEKRIGIVDTKDVRTKCIKRQDKTIS